MKLTKEQKEDVKHAIKLASEPWCGEVWFSKETLLLAKVSPEEISNRSVEDENGYIFVRG